MDKLDIVAYVDRRIRDNENIILSKISEQVVYWLLTGEKYEVDYTEIVPYDFSGQLYKISDKLKKRTMKHWKIFLKNILEIKILVIVVDMDGTIVLIKKSLNMLWNQL